MRNRLVHEDFRVDLDIVWNTVKSNLPELISRMEEILGEDENRTDEAP